MINIPRTDKKRVVMVGCGFAGLTLAKKLKNKDYQVVILDKHNYHQFPPLFTRLHLQDWKRVQSFSLSEKYFSTIKISI